MAKTQKYGIKYPFTTDNVDGYFLDLNDTMADGVIAGFACNIYS